MESKPRSLPMRILLATWRVVDQSRRIAVNLIFIAIPIAIIVALLWSGPRVPYGGALVVEPKGEIVEQLSSPTVSGLFEGAAREGNPETLLKDLIDAIQAAKDDKRIGSIYLNLSKMGPTGITKLEDLRASLVEFRKSGKKVIAYSDEYQQGAYAVAAAADEVWLHPQGMVFLEGLGRFRNYYKEGIDKLEIDWHVYRVGEYKSAVEPFLRNGPSPEAREADLKWLSDLWNSWVDAVAASRKLKPADVRSYIDQMPQRLESAKGDIAKLALDSGLVDKLGQRDEVRARMIELAGEEKKENEKTFKQVSVSDYLEARGGDRTGESGGGDAVAVIVAKGDILDGKQPAGKIGGDSTAALVRRARQDDKVKAIVLRVDSPGGSAFASEVIRRELAVARKDGKRVVVSMGSLAASGGYWISTASDEIWASPSTITGSIGIFGMFPTVEKPLAKYLGVRVDGVGTTRFTGVRPDRPLPAEVGRIIQLVIEKGYEDFLARVSEARKLTRDEVDRIARGRVWSGADAKERKLVDKLGGLKDALAAAADLAKLPKGYRVWYVEEEKGFKDWLAAKLMKSEASLARLLGLGADQQIPPLPPVLRTLQDQLADTARLLSFRDPNGVYAYCFCEIR